MGILSRIREAILPRRLKRLTGLNCYKCFDRCCQGNTQSKIAAPSVGVSLLAMRPLRQRTIDLATEIASKLTPTGDNSPSRDGACPSRSDERYNAFCQNNARPISGSS